MLLKSSRYKDIKYDILRTLRPLRFFCHTRKTSGKKDQVAQIGGLLILAMPESKRLFSMDPFPKRFMEISITTNGFHENNHTNCSSAFRSSNYCSLKDVNTMAAEQTNLLRNMTELGGC